MAAVLLMTSHKVTGLGPVAANTCRKSQGSFSGAAAHCLRASERANGVSPLKDSGRCRRHRAEAFLFLTETFCRVGEPADRDMRPSDVGRTGKRNPGVGRITGICSANLLDKGAGAAKNCRCSSWAEWK